MLNKCWLLNILWYKRVNCVIMWENLHISAYIELISISYPSLWCRIYIKLGSRGRMESAGLWTGMWSYLKDWCRCHPFSDQGLLRPGDQPISTLTGAKMSGFLSNNWHHYSLEGGKKSRKSYRDLSDRLSQPFSTYR